MRHAARQLPSWLIFDVGQNMIEFVIPILFVGFGVACIIRPQQIGVAFCRLGKATWKMSTLGLTDMRWFYPEEKAAWIFRRLGVAFVLLSIPWVFIAIFSLSGPGALAAMRESRSHLNQLYGPSRTWKLSTQSVPSGEGDYLVIYRYGERAGTLRASWKGDHYVFSEEKK